jgi:phospholipase D-like protein
MPVLAVALLFLWVFCIFDVISSDPTLVRNLPKLVWLLIVVIVPDIGSIAWLILGRPAHAAFRPGSTVRRAPAPPRAPLGPEDSSSFMSSIDERRRLAAWENELRKREEDLRKRDDEQ